ncbi:3-carboxy-cis,cis-muconate cycloisomerase [Arsenicibacter rosenii]|uniref:3-carboxy-cis,cis-muconate cycloisomerase n=1 Tax=Arsenicibacter rosenii TaxID=1750698 RepID=A0A1S2VNK6_9BACT|nr:3-carboxy-cis,cis-muconate cycloisomerase [Arsenicibacter rosenii]OIN59756.1 3-carboxy-cis,cis-muconate cycloisomerase [Arsenicibacter rosenii]
MSLYTNLFYSEAAQRILSDEQQLSRMLAFEAALAQAQSRAGRIPDPAAQTIAAACSVQELDIDRLRQETALGGNAAIPMVKQLTGLVRQRDETAAHFVHLGATSQDVVDTATVLQIRDYLHWLLPQLARIEQLLTGLTHTHRQTVMVGRTLLQQAKPITFGLKTAYWLAAVRKSRQQIGQEGRRIVQVQAGGAVGSRNEHITVEVVALLAEVLDLSAATPWHTQREGLVTFGASLGLLTGTLGKIAKDVSLLMQTEVAEVLEGKAAGKGGSSTMPHKRNPVTSAAILANATRVPGLISTLYATMLQEHERSAGGWHAEWETLTDIMQLTAGAVEKALDLLTHLEVDASRMRQNLELTNGLIYAENVSLALADKIGKAAAHELVEQACAVAVAEKRHLKDVLTGLSVPVAGLDTLFAPEQSLGQSLAIIDQILAEDGQ